MKKYLLLIALLYSHLSHSQDNNSDSLFFYQRETGRMLRDAQDSVRRSEKYILYQAAIIRLSGKSQNYFGGVLGSGILHSDLNNFNKSIIQDGFNPMKEIGWQALFGISSKNQNFMIDFYWVVGTFHTKSSNGEEDIRLSLTNFFELDLGYDLVKSRPISLYPYAGISLRSSNLAFNSPAQTNPNYTNIANLIINNVSASGNSFRVGYHLGLGLDLLFNSNRERGTGQYFFIKAGMNRPFWKDKYKIHDIKYEPGIKQGDWGVMFGIKFVDFE